MADDKWISAFEASRLLEAGGQHPANARQALIRQAQAGTVSTRCRRMIYVDFRAGPPDHDDREVLDDRLVPTRFWSEVNARDLQNGGDWHMGDFSITEEEGYLAQAFGVQFLLADLLKLPGVTAGASPPDQLLAPVESARRGPKGKGYWDEFWAEIAAQMVCGELSASRQSDIEKAMQIWLLDNGHDASESTIRLRAEKLWRALQRKADNSNN